MRVICVDDSPIKETGEPTGLIKYKEYFITGQCPESFGHKLEYGIEGVLLAGLLPPRAEQIDPIDGRVWCSCFSSDRFRPIKEIDVNAMFRCEEMVNT